MNQAVTKARTWARSLVAKKLPEPSYPTLPAVSDTGESNRPGLYLVGEVAGTPLIKLGLDAGHDIAERLHQDFDKTPGIGDDERYDVVIIGAGSSGLGCALRCKELGLRAVTLEANRWAQTVRNMTKEKFLFAEPADVPQKSRMWFEECKKEELLLRWQDQLAKEELDVREHEKVVDIKGHLDAFEVVTDKGSYRARRVVLAVGKAGNPRKAGVPGEEEHAARIHHLLGDPDAFKGQDVVVYGGGDVAAECVLALAPSNRVTMVTIDPEFVYPKMRNVDALRDLERQGQLTLKMSTRLVRVSADSVEVQGPSGKETLTCDTLFEMIGAELPLPFFKKIGLRLEGIWSPARWAALALSFALVYLLYAWKKGFPIDPPSDLYRPGEAMFPFNLLYPALARDTVVNILRPFGQNPAFWYSLLYTVVMVVFGIQAARRWNTRYQAWRFASLLFFQVAFFLIVNLAAPPVAGGDSWRAWGLYQPWPLFFNTFYWLPQSAIGWFFAGFGIFLVAVFMPLMARYQGKRFCTWICGCGGLAETLGDRWRDRSPKGKRSRAWEFQGVVILGWAATALVLTFLAFDGQASNPINALYSNIVDFWLVVVIPIALYPFYGGKVWCRYWCPLAAYNQILSKWFGKLKIVSNDKCISCTQCSKFCQVGVDVMAFAKNQTPFDNANSSCIHCGICIDVCPMGVLSFSSESPVAREQGRVHLKVAA